MCVMRRFVCSMRWLSVGLEMKWRYKKIRRAGSDLIKNEMQDYVLGYIQTGPQTTRFG
jgi:hypothetical protein